MRHLAKKWIFGVVVVALCVLGTLALILSHDGKRLVCLPLDELRFDSMGALDSYFRDLEWDGYDDRGIVKKCDGYIFQEVRLKFNKKPETERRIEIISAMTAPISVRDMPSKLGGIEKQLDAKYGDADERIKIRVDSLVYLGDIWRRPNYSLALLRVSDGMSPTQKLPIYLVFVPPGVDVRSVLVN